MCLTCFGFSCLMIAGKCCLSAVPTAAFRPYSIGCFRGCPFKSAIVANDTELYDQDAYSTCTVSDRAGTVDDYIPQVAAYVSEVNVASNAVTSAQSGDSGDSSGGIAVPTATPSTASKHLFSAVIPVLVVVCRLQR